MNLHRFHQIHPIIPSVEKDFIDRQNSSEKITVNNTPHDSKGLPMKKFNEESEFYKKVWIFLAKNL